MVFLEVVIDSVAWLVSEAQTASLVVQVVVGLITALGPLRRDRGVGRGCLLGLWVLELVVRTVRTHHQPCQL